MVSEKCITCPQVLCNADDEELITGDKFQVSCSSVMAKA